MNLIYIQGGMIANWLRLVQSVIQWLALVNAATKLRDTRRILDQLDVYQLLQKDSLSLTYSRRRPTSNRNWKCIIQNRTYLRAKQGEQTGYVRDPYRAKATVIPPWRSLAAQTDKGLFLAQKDRARIACWMMMDDPRLNHVHWLVKGDGGLGRLKLICVEAH